MAPLGGVVMCFLPPMEAGESRADAQPLALLRRLEPLPHVGRQGVDRGVGRREHRVGADAGERLDQQAERFEVIQEEKPSSFSRTGWPEMPDEIREDLHGPWSPQVNKAYWHGRAVSDAWAEVQLERLKNNAQEDAVNYKYAFSAELRGRNTVQTDGLVILNPPPKVYISVIATGYEEAIETALMMARLATGRSEIIALRLDDETIRLAGFSRSKVVFLRDLAATYARSDFREPKIVDNVYLYSRAGIAISNQGYGFDMRAGDSGPLICTGNICAHTHFYGAFARGMAIPGPAPKDFP